MYLRTLFMNLSSFTPPFKKESDKNHCVFERKADLKTSNWSEVCNQAYNEKTVSSNSVLVMVTCMFAWKHVHSYVTADFGLLVCAFIWLYFSPLKALRKTGLLKSDPRLRDCVHQMRQSTRDSLGPVMMDKKLFRRWEELYLFMETYFCAQLHKGMCPTFTRIWKADRRPSVFFLK